jgi:TolA-binding protein
MADLDALALELRRQVQPPPGELLAAQRARILADPRETPSWRNRALVAAFVVLALAVFLVPIARRAESTAASVRPIAAPHAPLQLTLDDGTLIRLDPGAKGAINHRSDNGIRVDLEHGGADFKVAPQKGRGFSVVAGRYEISVLGTHFAVRFEPPDKLAVSVEHGLVSVRTDGQPEVRLGAGQRFETDAPPAAPTPAAPNAAVALPTVAPPTASSAPSTSAARSRESAPGNPTWRELYSRRDYRAAIGAARQLGFARLTSSLGAEELAELADAARLAGATSEALLSLRALERRFPSTQQGRQASFLIGRVLLVNGRVSEAIDAFERYRQANPNGTYGTESIGRLMELYAKQDDTVRARDMARQYLARAPNGPYRRLARSLLSAQ